MNENVKDIAANDVTILTEKEKSYGDSWKKRGGVGAFMMLARKWDRIENQCSENAYDIFKCDPVVKDGLLDDISDLRRYLLLVESEILTRFAPSHVSSVREQDAMSPMLRQALFDLDSVNPGRSYVNQD